MEPHRTDVLLSIQNVLTDLEKTAFFFHIVSSNPQWKGAQVADVLDYILEHDEHLDVTEPMYEVHKQEVPEPRLIAAATLVIFYVVKGANAHNILRLWPAVLNLVMRVRQAETKLPELSGHAKDIYKNAVEEMQLADEIEGPMGDQYIALMDGIATEAARRRDNHRGLAQAAAVTASMLKGVIGKKDA
jgi:hypothetical protein